MNRSLLITLCAAILCATQAAAQPRLRQGGLPKGRMAASMQLAPTLAPVQLPTLADEPDARGVQQVRRKADSYTWTSIGTGTYREDILTTAYTVDNVTYSVEIEEATELPGFYRLVYPYGPAYPYNEEGDYDTDATYYLYIDATDPDYAYVLDSYQGLDWGETGGGYGMMQVNSYAYYYQEAGYTADYLSAYYPEYFGTLSNGVITMPDYYLLIGFENLEYWYAANTNGLFGVALPGYDLTDYDLDFFVTGQTTNAFGKEFITGDLYVGADVASVAYAVAESYDEINSVYAAILDGSADYSTATAAGELKISRTETGNTYLVLVAYDSEGTEQNAIYVSLPFVSTADTWTQVGTGVFNYGVEDTWEIGYTYYYTVSDSTAILYRNDAHDTYYQIKPWGSNDMGLVFVSDESANLLYVYHWATGEDYGDYGPVFVSDYVSYAGYAGYYDSYYTSVGSTYNFYLYFYVYAGGITFEKETFELFDATAISALPADEQSSATGLVRIYDTAGRLLTTADAATLNSASLPAGKGVLILQSDEGTRKIVR